jgi:hypothetical protein
VKTFLAIFSAVPLAILASAGILYFVSNRLHSRHTVNRNSNRYEDTIISEDQISAEESYARQVMKALSADDVISVCGEPLLDHVGNHGEDYKWRILVYPPI